MNNLTILICVHSQDNLHDKLLIEALDSLFKQTFKNFDILIVADECWDKTINLLEMYKKYDNRIEIKIKDKKNGLATAKNYGLSFINTEWIGFLDADDLYMPEKLEKQINFLQSHPNVDFLGTQAWNKNINNHDLYPSIFELGEYETHKDISNIIHDKNILTHGSMLIRKSALEKLEYYNNIKGKEDWDLWQRAIKAGYIFHQLQERLYVWTSGTRVER